MNIKILVYGSTIEIARRKLQDILDNTRYGDVKEVRKSKYDFTVTLKDGTIYKAIGASDDARGYKWQFAYIDQLIDTRIVDNVIFPSFYSEVSNFKDSYTWY